MMPPDTQRIVGVARLSNYLKRVIEEAPGLKNVAVRGEISNLRVQPGSGHCYFVLKEQSAILNCIVLARHAVDLPPLREGAKVVATGNVTTYEAQGRYQLRAESVRFEGEGDLFAAFEILRGKLAAEGLFALERKRPIPAFPFSIALVSSPAAEGANDFFTVVAQRSPHMRIRLFPTSVQGEHAPSQIVAAIRAAGASSADLVVVVRGGGSFEDLFAFSHESVVRAISACPLPVMTGIGHESDVTLADHAADLRASTPTDAAARLPRLLDLQGRLAQRRRGLELQAAGMIETLRAGVIRLERRLENASPRVRLQERAQILQQARFRLANAVRRREEERARSLARLRERFSSAIDRSFEHRFQRMKLASTALGGRDPHRLLELGYSIVRVDGRVVKDATQVPPGTILTARLAHGTVRARVETTTGDERETINEF
jgi:exodeoxyribonuclease VII large subunit